MNNPIYELYLRIISNTLASSKEILSKFEEYLARIDPISALKDVKPIERNEA